MPDALTITLLGALATLGGGPVTVLIFRIIDRHQPDTPTPRFPMLHDDTLKSAGNRLRGGAWIGVLERLAVFAALIVGWREMIALTLAIKGLGRYPELRSGDNPAVAERFIIGTFVSVLWACGWAAAARAIAL